MPSIPLVAELGAKADGFQHLLNKTRIPDSTKQKLRPSMSAEELFTQSDSRIFVRARPIIPYDQEDPENKGISQKVPGRRDLVLMVPKISLSGECTIEPTYVHLDGTFIGATDTTKEVYEGSCAPLVNLSVDGASTCVICYGQTGSGKTYTTSGILRFIARDLSGVFSTHMVALTVIEIQATKNVDLLYGDTVQVAEDVSGNVQLLGGKVTECANSRELVELVEMAATQRSTKSTGRNETSSRSHMIARIQIVPRDSQWSKPGELFVVDLAGSENTADSATHDKARQMEAKFINTSLMTLKDCIRARSTAGRSSQHLHIPYRRSPLTLLLRDCFELAVRRPTKTVMIACISPLLRDARHTINTLRYAALLATAPAQKIMDADPDDPNSFDREQALEFLVQISKGRLKHPECILPEGDGCTMVHIPEAEFTRRIVESHRDISEKGAKMIYTVLWKKVVDARTKNRQKKVGINKPGAPSRTANKRPLPEMQF